MKKKIVGIVVVVLLIVGYGAYDHQQRIKAEQRADEFIKNIEVDTSKQENETLQVGTIEQTVFDRQENQIFTLKHIADTLTKDIGKKLTPSQVYDTVAQGTIIVYMDNHEYYFQSNDKEDKGYVLVTFNEDETVIEKIKYSTKIMNPSDLK